MSPRLRLAIRTLAVAIALLGAIDPAVTSTRVVRPPVDIAAYGLRAGDATGARTAGAWVGATRRSVDTIARALGDRAVVHEPRSASPLPCRASLPCVVIADRTAAIDIPADYRGPLSFVRVGDAVSPNVAIVGASAAPVAYVGAEAVVNVTMQGAGVIGRTTVVRVSDMDTPAGESRHVWTSDGDVTVPVRWWPIHAEPRVLFVTAEPLDGEATPRDNETLVDVRSPGGPMPVLVFEPRPSWAGTFVRRALESDSRLQVLSRTRLGATIGVGSENTRLDEETLLAAQAVVIGAPDSLGAAEADLLDRYVRTRGGSLILVPDRPLSGPVARLVPGSWTERLTAEPMTVGSLRAAELLTLDSPGDYDHVLGSTTDPPRPAIVAFPSGRGQIVVSGAMDAWRYRAEAVAPAFDRFWRALVVSAAEAGGPPVSITASPSLVSDGEPVELSVVRHTFDEGAVASGATVTCGSGGPETIRLWPTGDPSRFAGHFRPSTSGPCRSDVVLAASRVSADTPIVHAFPSAPRPHSWAALERAARASGGVVAAAGREGDVIAMLQALPLPPSEPIERHPMRSPWWIVPFAACLGVEWWDRRRTGLR